MSMKCFCHSGEDYDVCCKPYHFGEKEAPTALALMRSRYAAYSAKLPDYIIETTHKQNPSYQEPKEIWRNEILSYCQSTEFQDLKIIEQTENGFEATVTFKAFLKQNGKQYCHFEKSLFEKIKGKWLYKSGTFLK